MTKTIRYKDKDYKGLTDLFKHNNSNPSVSLNAFSQRYRLGWTIDKALNTPVSVLQPIRYKGKDYKSLAQLFRNNNPDPSINLIIFNSRYRSGWGISKALNTPKIYNRDTKKTLIYNGIEYKSQTDLFNNNKHHYSVNLSMFSSRIGNGWDIKDALFTPKRYREDKILYKGVVYKDFKEIYDNNNHDKSLSLRTFHRRLKKGASIDEALGVDNNADKN